MTPPLNSRNRFSPVVYIKDIILPILFYFKDLYMTISLLDNDSIQ